MTISCITISDQVAREIAPGKSLRDPSCNPLRNRVGGRTERHDASPILAENHHGVEEPKADRRDDEKINAGDAGCVVLQKGLPAL